MSQHLEDYIQLEKTDRINSDTLFEAFNKKALDDHRTVYNYNRVGDYPFDLFAKIDLDEINNSFHNLRLFNYEKDLKKKCLELIFVSDDSIIEIYASVGFLDETKEWYRIKCKSYDKTLITFLALRFDGLLL